MNQDDKPGRLSEGLGVANGGKEVQDATELVFWREAGKWCCAVPRDDIGTQAGLHWKRYGLIGRGATRKKALGDWHLWQRASEFVAEIY